MPDVSPIQLAIVLIIALVILGPKRLPDVGKSLGRGIREFKDSVSGHDVLPGPLPSEAVAMDPTATAVPLTEVLAAGGRPVAAVAGDRVVVSTTETT
jgi:sec-independent protein translocase protein TatA